MYWNIEIYLFDNNFISFKEPNLHLKISVNTTIVCFQIRVGFKMCFISRFYSRKDQINVHTHIYLHQNKQKISLFRWFDNERFHNVCKRPARLTNDHSVAANPNWWSERYRIKVKQVRQRWPFTNNILGRKVGATNFPERRPASRVMHCRIKSRDKAPQGIGTAF